MRVYRIDDMSSIMHYIIDYMNPTCSWCCDRPPNEETVTLFLNRMFPGQWRGARMALALWHLTTECAVRDKFDKMSGRDPSQLYVEQDLHDVLKFSDALALEARCAETSRELWGPKSTVIPRAVQALKLGFLGYYEGLWHGVNHWGPGITRRSYAKNPQLLLNQPYAGFTVEEYEAQARLAKRP